MAEKSYSGAQVQKAQGSRWNGHVGIVEPKTYGRGKSMAGAFLVGIDFAKIEQRYVDLYTQCWIDEWEGIQNNAPSEVERRERAHLEAAARSRPFRLFVAPGSRY